MTTLKVGNHTVHYPKGTRVSVGRTFDAHIREPYDQLAPIRETEEYYARRMGAAALQGYADGLACDTGYEPLVPPEPAPEPPSWWAQNLREAWTMLKEIEWWPGRASVLG